MYYLKTLIVNLLLIVLTCSGEESSYPSAVDKSIYSSSDINKDDSSYTSTFESQSSISDASSIETISSTTPADSKFSSEISVGSEDPSNNLDSQATPDSIPSNSSEPSSSTTSESSSYVDASSTPSTDSITSESFVIDYPFSNQQESIESSDNSVFKSQESPTESLTSTEPSTECFIPDCRWCDHLDLESCHCYRLAVDCWMGFTLSEDGCSCIQTSEWDFSTPEEMPSNPDASTTELSSSECFPTECPRKMFWNQATCSCECLKEKMCRKNLEFNPSTCECEQVTTTEPIINTTMPSDCSMPSCRWCDINDEDNCACHKTYLDCAPGFMLSPDKCECIKIESSQNESIESSSECLIPPCRPCDVLDLDNCVCHRKIIDCAEGFELSDDRCECEKEEITSENCPDLECPEDTFIDENRCVCVNEECKLEEPCRENFEMDPSSCECFCNLSPWQCKHNQMFDRKNCKCRRKNDYYNHEDDEDPENCEYECVQKERCHKNFIFDYNKCECVCDSKKSTKKCPEGTKFDKLACDCVECLDYDDPQCNCDCDEILDCPGHQIFNYIGCECECPNIYCEKGYEMDERTCECVWRGHGKHYKYNNHGGHSRKTVY